MPKNLFDFADRHAEQGWAAVRTQSVIRRHSLAIFFALTYGISWLIWAPLWLPTLGVRGLPILPFHHALGALGPVIAAFLVSAMESGRRGPLDLLRGMALLRGRLPWVAVAMLAPLVILAIGVGAAALLAGEHSALADFGRSREFPQFSALTFLAYNIVAFGFGEEVGWRGFALPRLQARRSALAATVLLTFAWALWHLPLFFYRPGYTSMGPAGVAGWFFSLLTGAVLLTWLYNQSRGSILVVALFHASVDVAFTSSVASPFAVNVVGGLITIWGIAVLVVTGLRKLTKREQSSTS